MQRHDNQLGRQTVTFPSRTKDTNVGMIRINRQQKPKDWQRCEKAIIEIAITSVTWDSTGPARIPPRIRGDMRCCFGRFRGG